VKLSALYCNSLSITVDIFLLIRGIYWKTLWSTLTIGKLMKNNTPSYTACTVCGGRGYHRTFQNRLTKDVPILKNETCANCRGVGLFIDPIPWSEVSDWSEM